MHKTCFLVHCEIRSSTLWPIISPALPVDNLKSFGPVVGQEILRNQIFMNIVSVKRIIQYMLMNTKYPQYPR